MKIACVVLTYNRLSLLKRCIDSIRNQTYQEFDIYVIDNASTDGTAHWLSLQNDLTVISIHENKGPANGFYTCLQVPYDDGYDWIWMMDDDGVADKGQLEELLNKTVKNNLYFTNALVCNIDNPEKIAFGAKKTIDTQREELIKGNINPFNGTFIHRRVIEKNGNIMREMYMYGCETEFQLRAIKNGVQVATVTSAIHYHPSPKVSICHFIPYIKYCSIIDYPIDTLFYIRNKAYINYTYLGFKRSLFMITSYSLYYLFRLKIRKVLLFWKYYREGCKGVVGNKKQ